MVCKAVARSERLCSGREVSLYSLSTVLSIEALTRPAAVLEVLLNLIINLFAKVNLAVEVWHLVISVDLIHHICMVRTNSSCSNLRSTFSKKSMIE